MQFRLGTAGRSDSGRAVRERRRGPAPALLAIGSLSLVTGAVMLYLSLAPFFVNPLSVAANSPRAPIDQAVVAAPTPDAVLPPKPRPSPDTVAAARPPAPAPLPEDGAWFEIRVPALGYSAMVRQGVGANILEGGPGHYPSTPWPGHVGNVGIAAHNTYWLSFGHLKPGDRVELRTRYHTYTYVITGSKVVSPSDRTVLAPTSDARLTLTTCDPLWAGAFATKRLIFFAREI